MPATGSGDPPPPSPNGQRPATPAPTRPPGRGFSIAGGVLGVMALFVAPIALGPVGLALAYVGHRAGDPRGRSAMLVAAAGTVLGLVLGYLAFRQAGGVSAGA